MTEVPICGYCGLSEQWHQPNDHPFDAVGGSLEKIDPLFGHAPLSDQRWPVRVRFAVIGLTASLVWGVLILLFIARRAFFHS